jgi:sialidase-1
MRDPRGQRIAAWSTDQGSSWGPSKKVLIGGRIQTAVCEGSPISAGPASAPVLLFSGPFAAGRENMTVFTSQDAGLSWDVVQHIDSGPSAYSALIALNDTTAGLVYESGGYGALTFRTVAVPMTMAGPK